MSSYKQMTPHFGIPVVGKGDKIQGDVEFRKYSIIENMLIAGTQGLSEVVFDDGDYKLVENGEEFEVNVRAGGTYPSIHGIVAGFYFRAPPRVVWDGLKKDYFYYLYIKATPNTPHENSSVRAISSTYELNNKALLVATVDLRSEPPVVNPNPDGKIYSSDVARHASDTSNPHGRKLEQDELLIKKVLSLGEEAHIEIAGSLIPVSTFSQTAASLAGQKTEMVDFQSGGPDGVVLKVSGKVRFVQVQQRWDSKANFELAEIRVGDVGIGYFGENDDVDSEREFVVYNTGGEGLPMRALVLCG